MQPVLPILIYLTISTVTLVGAATLLNATLLIPAVVVFFWHFPHVINGLIDHPDAPIQALKHALRTTITHPLHNAVALVSTAALLTAVYFVPLLAAYAFPFLSMLYATTYMATLD